MPCTYRAELSFETALFLVAAETARRQGDLAVTAIGAADGACIQRSPSTVSSDNLTIALVMPMWMFSKHVNFPRPASCYN